MLDIYARFFQEATRFSPYTRPDPRTLRRLEAGSAQRRPRLRSWRHWLSLV